MPMWGIFHMRVMRVIVAPRTGKIVRNGLSVFERGEKFLQNGILHFVLSSEIALES